MLWGKFSKFSYLTVIAISLSGCSVKLFHPLQALLNSGHSRAPALVTPPPVVNGVNSTWFPDGDVETMKQVGNILYLGGDFKNMGHLGSAAVFVDATTGARSTTMTQPAFSSSVDFTVMISDGATGWYAGGSSSPYGNVVHILSDGSIDSSFIGPSVAGTVYSLHLSGSGSTLYIGGAFATVNGSARHGGAAVNAVTGSLLAWDPNVAGGFADIMAIGEGSSSIYIGGAFTSVGGTTRTNLAAVDPTTGVATSWDPEPDGYVTAFAVVGTSVYVGGRFSNIDSQARSLLVEYNDSTGILTSWDPALVGTYGVTSIVPNGSTLYVGGTFSQVGADTRSNIAEIDRTTALATSWDPDADSYVLSIAKSGSTIYLGGDFSHIGGVPRNAAAAVSATTGLATSWDPGPGGSFPAVYGFGINGSTILLAGEFTLINSKVRSNVAAIDVTTGELTNWDPEMDSSVYAIEESNGVIYLGGNFSTVGGQSFAHIVSVDNNTGAPYGWGPFVNGDVHAIMIMNGIIYCGGTFTNVAGQARNHAVAFDSNGVNAWDPEPNADVKSIIGFNDHVYIAGLFTSLGATTRFGIAETDILTGAPTTWDAGGDGTVTSMAKFNDLLYLTGTFSTIGGFARSGLAALNVSGTATAWDPQIQGSLVTVIPTADAVYVSGGLWQIGATSVTAGAVAAVDASAGGLLWWAGDSSYGNANATALAGSTLYVAGFFNAISDVTGINDFAALSTSTGTGL